LAGQKEQKKVAMLAGKLGKKLVVKKVSLMEGLEVVELVEHLVGKTAHS